MSRPILIRPAIIGSLPGIVTTTLGGFDNAGPAGIAAIRLRCLRDRDAIRDFHWRDDQFYSVSDNRPAARYVRNLSEAALMRLVFAAASIANDRMFVAAAQGMIRQIPEPGELNCFIMRDCIAFVNPQPDPQQAQRVEYGPQIIRVLMRRQQSVALRNHAMRGIERACDLMHPIWFRNARALPPIRFAEVAG